jgi:hypothetical protein
MMIVPELILRYHPYQTAFSKKVSRLEKIVSDGLRLESVR